MTTLIRSAAVVDGRSAERYRADVLVDGTGSPRSADHSETGALARIG